MLYMEELYECLLIKGGTISKYFNTLYLDWMYWHSSGKAIHRVLKCVVKLFTCLLKSLQALSLHVDLI